MLDVGEILATLESELAGAGVGDLDDVADLARPVVGGLGRLFVQAVGRLPEVQTLQTQRATQTPVKRGRESRQRPGRWSFAR